MDKLMEKIRGKRGQEQKSKILMSASKRAQEEMVGFGVIIIIVSIILVAFLVFSLSSNKTQPPSYEASSFLQSMIHETTTCNIGSQYLSVNDLVVSCLQNQTCSSGQNSCDLLNDTINGIMDKSWPYGPDFPVKGYNLTIVSNMGNVLNIQKGNITGTYKGAQEILPASGTNITAVVTVYS